jgi:phage-related holin
MSVWPMILMLLICFVSFGFICQAVDSNVEQEYDRQYMLMALVMFVYILVQIGNLIFTVPYLK